MIIIPELETVVILPPRTGSKALRNALLSTHPQSFMPYRHMEADGVPHGYDQWRRVGICRHPIDRLWSLYRYVKVMGEGREPDGKGKWEPGYIEAQADAANRPFDDWIINNRLPFTTPYSQGDASFYPNFCVLHALPENRKSQKLYLRPDLGTQVYGYECADRLHKELGVNPDRINAAPPASRPTLSNEALEHIYRFFSWDLANCHADPSKQ